MKNRPSFDKKILFLRVCFWIGGIADLLATVLLLSSKAAKQIFGMPVTASGADYLYVSRIAASLMLGWTFLLFWGSWKPVERKGVLLLTVVPVLVGLTAGSILAVQSGMIQMADMLSMWIFYAVIIPLYVIAYFVAHQIENTTKRPKR